MKMSREVILGDHFFNSHDLSDCLSIDFTRRNTMLITIRVKVGAWSV